MVATATENPESRHSSEKTLPDNSTMTTTTAEPLPQQGDSLQDTTEKQHDATSQQPAEPEYPGALKLTLTMLALCISIFLVALDQTIIAPALGAITSQFHSTKDIVSRIVLVKHVRFLTVSVSGRAGMDLPISSRRLVCSRSTVLSTASSTSSGSFSQPFSSSKSAACYAPSPLLPSPSSSVALLPAWARPVCFPAPS